MPRDRQRSTSIRRDEERIARNTAALAASGLDGIACALPMNVLLLSGYWPVVGTGFAILTRDGRVGLLAPEDETELAALGWADKLHSFRPSSAEGTEAALEAVREPLRELMRALGIAGGRIGGETGPTTTPVSYAAMYLYGAAAPALIAEASGGESVPADEILAHLRATLTPREAARVRSACRIAGDAFTEGAAALNPGRAEAAVAAAVQGGLLAPAEPGVTRTEGFAFCMAGANAAQAGAAYARSRFDPLRAGELALVHANSSADGYWTDITRTYCLGEPTPRQRTLYEAVFAAREAALAAIRPGASGGEVDRAARDELTARGFSDGFTHGVGHGVGFAAIDAGARPRLRPGSADLLEPGMVFNIEPAIYVPGECGIRHCDVVAVTDNGYELLTPFQTTLDALVLAGHALVG